MTATSTDTDFGFRRVDLDAKQGLVDDVFHKVAGRYDLMNDFMSVGLHRVWKDVMVNRLGISKTRAFNHLDVAGGTGDVAFKVVSEGSGARANVCDINGEMLKVGRQRAAERDLDARVEFVQGNAEELPFPSSTFDGYTIAFGIRNVPRIQKALDEAHRVLRPGGRLLVLEFSPEVIPGLDRAYDLYSFNIIPPMGKLVTGDAQPYQYLVESIRKFPRPQVFAGMIAKAGFSRVDVTPMTGGVVCLHGGWKI
ncbi:bifunctional demethylmenaquinone methyltransferase/2-methoxy-6-polyprenyl-1,4-benzoquinol methylase UbiE [Phreatobacter aquaticus]|uniref:Ubiquinone/menaquinone biosynthesis C-methyltransferase UbiE n=1 Tax=Phreatobacter aquaticus TaxID=2570229 RepID=A0A4D7QCI9_9HYPH|nr:bifunctional demethylmenaquinone methyltransferase/2-methoxy-6-polyprenyl-1,4-benzoquinol methylase UbiE [Phreatobacter aquaticus]QCK85720.1 bifunctional demethylmenaquinone methyltransferase/2-methoxy-6-polyprenyl-1,4-benzoquinol methylase UbiE [Phreatobacter aquaticus]